MVPPSYVQPLICTLSASLINAPLLAVKYFFLFKWKLLKTNSLDYPYYNFSCKCFCQRKQRCDDLEAQGIQ